MSAGQSLGPSGWGLWIVVVGERELQVREILVDQRLGGSSTPAKEYSRSFGLRSTLRSLSQLPMEKCCTVYILVIKQVLENYECATIDLLPFLCLEMPLSKSFEGDLMVWSRWTPS